MKFSHSIQFNAVPDWSSHYIAYSNLKKLLFQLEKRVNQRPLSRDAESSPLLEAASTEDDLDKTFTVALDRELEKICSFYQLKELEIYGELDHALKDEQHQHDELEQLEDAVNTSPTAARPASPRLQRTQSLLGRGKRGRANTISDDSDEESETAPLRTSRTIDVARPEDHRSDYRSSMRRSSFFEDYHDMAFSVLYDTGITLKKSFISIYVSLCELRSFIQLNRTGFRKVLKKYDKVLDRRLKYSYVRDHVATAYPFEQTTMDRLTSNIGIIEQAYARFATQGNVDEAKRELRLHLREHVVWERNTVWREMIGIERKGQAANLGLRQTILGDAGGDERNVGLQGDDVTRKEPAVRIGSFRVPSWLISPTFYTLLVILAIFLALLSIPILTEPEQQNCLAMVVFVSLMWATEAIPLFVTSLLVPFLAVILRIPRSDQTGLRLGTKAATSYIFSAMWTPTIMLLLGGFTIAAALSKYNIAKRMATFVLSKAGTTPRTVLLTNMFVATFASMWISNVAAPVLCFSIIQPILRNLPGESNMSKALIMGIALASNIGGAASPISSPQNLIALENMSPEPGWGTWFFISIPICIISNILIWLVLLITFQPGKNTTIVPIRPVKDPFTGVQWFISVASIGTIILWCVSHQLDYIFGDMGVIAIIPLLLFFGTGVLTKEDFNNFLWTIIILAAGGLALGKAVNSSGLLHTMATFIMDHVQGLSLYAVTAVFAAIVLIVATFISHTVAALIFLPLVQQVGQGMPEPHPNLLVMISVLMCSAAMGLPTSGFPNMSKSTPFHLQVRC
jgi:phosphate transporter